MSRMSLSADAIATRCVWGFGIVQEFLEAMQPRTKGKFWANDDTATEQKDGMLLGWSHQPRQRQHMLTASGAHSSRHTWQ